MEITKDIVTVFNFKMSLKEFQNVRTLINMVLKDEQWVKEHVSDESFTELKETAELLGTF